MLAWFASTKIGRWLIGLGAVVAAILAALGIGWARGRKAQADANKTKDAETIAEAAQATVNAAVVRQEVANETAKLPDAPAQRVLDADRNTAAGHLREWMRGADTPAADPGKAGSAD